jgi:hypothetical protein
MLASLRIAPLLATALFIASPALANDYHVEIINKTGLAMKHFYASVTSTDSWEEDILGRDILEDGESFEANINDGSGKCRYDFKAVFENGASLVRGNVNVCEVSSFTYNR